MTAPPPTTFSEGQRRLYGWMIAAAGVSYSLAAIAAGIVIIWGNWPANLAYTRLLLIGGAMFGAVIGSIAVTVALAVGGPVGKFSVKASRDSAEFEATSDE